MAQQFSSCLVVAKAHQHITYQARCHLTALAPEDWARWEGGLGTFFYIVVVPVYVYITYKISLYYSIYNIIYIIYIYIYLEND